MRIVLMNAANMPNDGVYWRHTITKEEFVKLIKDADEIYSSIGYESVAALITELTDIPVEKNRDLTVLNPTDTILVIKLKYRVGAKDKGYVEPTINDYEFLKVNFIKKK